MINYSDEYIAMLAEEAMNAIKNGDSDYDAMRAMLTKHEEEQAAAWDTTCSGCRRLLDELSRRDKV